MCGRAYEPSFLFSWPNARVSVMGGEQAARVMEIVLRQARRHLKKMWSPAPSTDTRERCSTLAARLPEAPERFRLPIHPMGLEIFAQGAGEVQKMGFDLAPGQERGLAQPEAPSADTDRSRPCSEPLGSGMMASLTRGQQASARHLPVDL